MTRLTEHTVLARTRAQDLKSVRKLNAWGSELTDVSIVKSLPNVEVLSLSVNSIASLQDFAYCNNLQELYLRKNNIADLSEIRHLQDLTKLRSLWLADNPCAEAEQYRLTVIRTLPQLQKLDNITIQQDELENAKLHGSLLESVHSSAQPSQVSPVESIIQYETIQSSESHMSCAFESRITSKTTTPQASPLEPFPPCTDETISPTRSYMEETTSLNQYRENEQNLELSAQQYYNVIPKSQNNSSSGKHMINMNESKGMFESEFSSDVKTDLMTGDRVQTACSFTPSAGRPNTRGSTTRLQMLPKGGKNRNANILSAVLCLIKELDWPSLEVVDTAVHCLMEELESENPEFRSSGAY